MPPGREVFNTHRVVVLGNKQLEFYTMKQLKRYIFQEFALMKVCSPRSQNSLVRKHFTSIPDKRTLLNI